MMGINKYILTEALSSWLDVKVNLKSECADLDGAFQLDVTKLPTLALLGYKDCDPVSQTVWDLLVGLFIGDASQTSEQTSAKESKDSSLRKELFVIPDEFFDPQFDFDFTKKSDSSECMRGNEPYKRPCGWKRFALKVRDKYPDGNEWLGTNGWRSRSVAGEWPVSYHGTGLQGAEGIIQSNYKAGDRQAYGRGIYSSPDIKVAEDYATSKQFTSQKNGKTYKVIMQNRINPKNRTIIKEKNFWLVPIPDGTSPQKEKEIVESSIRPYGLLIKEVKVKV